MANDHQAHVPPMQVRIPQPCGEDFGAMPAVSGGRYCGSCAKVITDFTKMTDAQLIDWFAKHRGGCGTFRRDQLNRDLIAPEIKKAPFGMKWLLSLLILTGCVRNNDGQKSGQKTAVVEQPASPDSMQLPDTLQNVDPGQQRTKPPFVLQTRQPNVIILDPEPVLGGVPMQSFPEPAVQVPQVDTPMIMGEMPALNDTVVKVPPSQQRSIWQRLGLQR
jgi:hypothetical protein